MERNLFAILIMIDYIINLKKCIIQRDKSVSCNGIKFRSTNAGNTPQDYQEGA